MAPRAGTAAVVLVAVLFCLLVSPALARRPVELPPQVEPYDVEHEAFVEQLLPKPLAGVDAADAAVPEDEEVARARAQGGLVFPRGGDAATVSSSDEPLSLHGEARPSPKVEEEDKHERPYDSDASDTDCDTDSDASDNECDTDSDDDDDEGGVVGWFWRLAGRLI